VRIIETPDTDTTGNFDVIVNGVKVHCKKDGDGFLDEDEKLDKVFDAINAALNYDGAYAAGGEDVEAAGAAVGGGDKAGDSSRKSLDSSTRPESPLLGGKPEDPSTEKTQRRSLAVSICTLLMSIPALIGA